MSQGGVQQMKSDELRKELLEQASFLHQSGIDYKEVLRIAERLYAWVHKHDEEDDADG